MVVTALMTLLGFGMASGSGRCAAAAEAPMALMVDGQARATIIRQLEADAIESQAIDAFQSHFHRATGQLLPVVTSADVAGVPEAHVQVLFGRGPATERLGLGQEPVVVESYRVVARDNHLVFLGVDAPANHPDTDFTPDSPATRWAVYHFLDRVMGVRWLWPGELGTYVPKTTTVVFEPFDVTHRPELEFRRLRTGLFVRRWRHGRDGMPELMTRDQHARLVQEAVLWQEHHQFGSRTDIRFGDVFHTWWEKYRTARPEVLAQPPKGMPAHHPNIERRVKLCVSHPQTAQTVLEEWVAAGAPDQWNVAPTDGSPGFCTCADCRAWDDLPEETAERIWRGGQHGLVFTGRYVHFWNRLLEQMQAVNPRVRLRSLAYSFYSTPPEEGFRFHPGMVLSVVPRFDEASRAMWLGWHRTGAGLLLRPNWWNTGAMAPVLPLQASGDYFRFAQAHGMLGFDMDTLMGHWATQGPAYYLIARLAQRPDLSIEQILMEYASGFGSAQAEVRRYLQFWEDFTYQAGYPTVAGGGIEQAAREQLPYQRLLGERQLPSAALIGGWLVLPLLYTDAVFSEAEAILDAGEAALAPQECQARERLQFLRDGLQHVRLSRDVIELAYPQLRPAGATRDDYRRKAAALQTLRTELTARHVIWGEVLYGNEQQRRVPTVEAWLEVVGTQLDWE